MMSVALRRLTRETTERQAWGVLLRDFIKAPGIGNIGCHKGKKVMVKVNPVGCIFDGAVNPMTYDLTRDLDQTNTSPLMMVSVLRRVVQKVSVIQEDISIGDTLALFPNQYYNICHKEFLKVRYFDHDGGTASHPQTRIEPSSLQMDWSIRPADKAPDYVPAPHVEARSFIRIANLKSHTSTGVMLSTKNHFGSLSRPPLDKRCHDLDGGLPKEVPGAGHYRNLVDVIGNTHIGAKTVPFLIDGLYPGVHPIERSTRKWSTAHFNSCWTSSVFASQDPVPIEWVCVDFLWANGALTCICREQTTVCTKRRLPTIHPRERHTLQVSRRTARAWQARGYMSTGTTRWIDSTAETWAKISALSLFGFTSAANSKARAMGRVPQW